ncbi:MULTISPECIES: ABC transporter ATP-binding protein [Cysteiniphilum]|uniref:ABC transporter ATP-binding protein n=1 Tax=Cysteiniphilum litorale TaxID=2056700 RepID=A0A8J2Z249_9GAMM|nr:MULTISPECIES: ATP-binding cassette domain-containing protein [Cysteiniphilum]GGF87974.1 ABC transporter ATP-binding protein [Cysteiniphilum litorale]
MSHDHLAVSFDRVAFFRGEKCIYKNLTCNIPKGKITAILGPSGTGKTTLLHLIGRLIKAQSGDIRVLDHELDSLDKKALLALRKKMGVLFQSGALFTQLSVFDNVAFPLRQNSNLSEYLIHNLVLMKLQSVGLRGTADMMPSELSGGMARRVALARAIALDPDLMLYDEPFTGQDPISLKVILTLIKELNDALHMTSVIVSHDIDEVMSIADHVIIIANQQVMLEGSPEFIKNSKDPFVSQFLSGSADGPVAFDYPAPNFLSTLQ